MPANTPIFGFPYPLGTDPVSQGDNVIQELAEDVETVINTGMGLRLVKSQAIGSTAVTSVPVTSAFSSAFDNYLITVSGTTPSTSANWFEFGFNTADTTGFFGNAYGINFAGTVTNTNTNNLGRLLITQTNAAAGSNGFGINVFSPFAATRTSIFSTGNLGPGWMIAGGEHNPAVSQTQFFIRVSAGTFSNGTIRVYGYRN
jgi:hypothetical protein